VPLVKATSDGSQNFMPATEHGLTSGKGGEGGGAPVQSAGKSSSSSSSSGRARAAIHNLETTMSRTPVRRSRPRERLS
jgi:hypothetical protein